MSDRTNLAAPVLPLDYPWQEGETQRACMECLPWSIEFFFDTETEQPWVREWHAVGCPIWQVTGGR